MRYRYPLLILLVVIGISFFVFRAFAIDLGGNPSMETGGGGDVIPVKVEEQPVQISETDVSAILEVVKEIQLSFEETYESPFLDVREYRDVSFFVQPTRVLTEPNVAVSYQLDAFFSVDTSSTSYLRFGGEKETTTWDSQEFGLMKISESGETTEAMFDKLSTGETSNRVLHTPIYGPYVRLVLKSLTQADRRRFRIVAYLRK